MVDLAALRQTIEQAPTDRPVAGVVSIEWLKEVEKDLSELEERRSTEAAKS